jgi:hypothetical protein
MMNYFKKFLTLFLILFFLVTIITFDHNSQADGFDYFGFPFVFYTYFEGKCHDCRNLVGFDLANFALDVLAISFVATLLLFINFKFIKKPRQH